MQMDVIAANVHHPWDLFVVMGDEGAHASTDESAPEIPAVVLVMVTQRCKHQHML